ncbi:MAG: hypothetical protein U0793_14535 [Gemmataceae bacterium]
MSAAFSTTERQQQKVREFMSLLPLTLAIAGLPESEIGRYFNEGQMENRVITVRTAWLAGNSSTI